MARKILIVDDCTSVRQHVAKVLGRQGYQVLQAQDGVAAIGQLTAHPEMSLIISDLHIPGVDGLDLLTLIREQRRFDAVPFVVLTTDSMPELASRVESLRAHSLLLKPVCTGSLVETVQRLLTE